MKEAVADFVGRYVVDPAGGVGTEPTDCRVVMNRRQLVIASDDERLTVPLSSVVDVVVGNVPPDLRDLFDDTVTVGYRPDDGEVRTVLVEADDGAISKFVDVLFRCLLNDTEVVVKHPARIGGRVADVDFAPGKLSIGDERVDVARPEESFSIDVTAVVGFDRTERSSDGTERPTLIVKHADGTDVVTSLLAPTTSRKVNLLGRYIRIEYGQLRREVAEIDLGEPEKQLLVAVYATGGDIDFQQVLGGNAAQATNVLNSLREKGLIDEGETGVVLTSRGRIVVTERLEDVNV